MERYKIHDIVIAEWLRRDGYGQAQVPELRGQLRHNSPKYPTGINRED
jgi:hypothetical protein